MATFIAWAAVTATAFALGLLAGWNTARHYETKLDIEPRPYGTWTIKTYAVPVRRESTGKIVNG